MIRTDYIEENRPYARAECIAALEMMDDDDFAALVALDEELTGAGGPGIASKIVITSAPASSFDDARETSWRERGARDEVICCGRACVVYTDVQTAKGQQRASIAVMPWGEKTLVLQA